MKYILKYGCFLLLLFMSFSASAEVVHSIDQIQPQIHNEDGKAILSHEMNGGKLPDEFGSGFWSAHRLLKPSEVINIIAPQYKDETWSFVGMKAWPGQKDRYIVVACSIQKTQDKSKDDQENDCLFESVTRDKIMVAIVDYDGEGAPKLVAKPYIEKINSDEYGRVDEANANTLEKNAFNLKNDSDEIVVGNLQRLDFAHYQLNPQTLAFGI